MTIKQKIVCLSAIILTFIVVIVTIFVVKHKKEEKIEEIRHYAENGFTEEESNTNVEKINEQDTEYDTTIYNYYVNDDNCDINKLNAEQKQHKQTFYKLINHQCKKSVKEVTIESNDGWEVYIHVIYTDGEEQDMVVIYDEYTQNNFLRCIDKEQWEKETTS